MKCLDPLWVRVRLSEVEGASDCSVKSAARGWGGCYQWKDEVARGLGSAPSKRKQEILLID